ncbi:MAG: YbaB/EbfC family nucleoid-associated protein, partial [Firmicutes bacterium]|nr:YbaB/EbfC family nucleoid-associated protein [Bacillota bacterium]
MGRGMRAGKKQKVGGGAGNMQQQLKQMQAMQRQMEAMQEELEAKEFTTTSGGGAVSVTANGKREIVNLTIDKDVVDPDDVEM